MVFFQIRVVATARLARVRRPTPSYVRQADTEHDLLTVPRREYSTGPPGTA